MHECETCGDDFKRLYRGQMDCLGCQRSASVDPAELAERQYLDEQSFGLEEPIGYGA